MSIAPTLMDIAEAPQSYRPSRRRLLGGALLLIPLAGLAAWLHTSEGPMVPGLGSLRAATDVTALFSDREAARRVGLAYLQQVPAEADRARLIALLGPEMLNAENAHTLLADMTRADFAANRTIIVQGWILSVTEARLAALAVVD